MKIYIKNMVCQGSRQLVLFELEKLGIKYRSLISGEIDLENDLPVEEINKLDHSLSKYGLEINCRYY
jgi:hypothetical protein